MAATINISLMGRVAVGAGEGPGAEVALGERSRVALAYLVLERWRPVSSDELAEVIWGAELPATWAAALRGIVHRVRGALGAAGLDTAGVLTTSLSGYQLHLPPDTRIDVEVADAAVTTARAACVDRPSEAAVHARQAAAACRGEFLSGVNGMWVERRQGELRELHVEALELLSEATARCDGSPAAIWAAEEAIALQPLRESAHRCLMAAQAAAGNRAEALRAYARCRQLLVDELGVGPSPQTEAAYIGLLGEEPSREHDIDRDSKGVSGCRPPPNNLPSPVTSFIGRERERAELKRLLASARLVTLTGMGGSGKSRLALEVARDLFAEHPDGVWLVELTNIADPTFVAEHVLAVLGGPDSPGRSPTDSLIGHFSRGQVLLLLDNCEHVVTASASLCHALLAACPGLHIVATSRERLGAAGETTWAVPPLATPGAGDERATELLSLLSYEAVLLFVDRARAAFPGFDLEPVSHETVEICRRLDGIPLAIELAAARTRHLAVPEIARRLGDRFGLLVGGPRTTPARHQTLRQALDWSYDALPATERAAFDRLSVFCGSFTLEMGETVCAGAAGPDVGSLLESISGLVDKSLLGADRSGPVTRFRFLETVRAYGQERLAASGCEVATRLAQLQWAAGVTESAEPALDGRHQGQSLAVLDAEHDNIRGALDWAACHDSGPLGLRIAASLWRYWEVRGFLSEGRSRLEALLPTAATAPPAIRAKALNSAGILAQNQLDHAGARAFYQEALDIRWSLGDCLGMAAALNGLGNVAVGQGDLASAQALFEQNLETSREIADQRMIAASLINLGVVLQLQFVAGQTDRAEGALRAHALYEESLHLYRQLGDRHGAALALENLGAVAPYRNDYPAAEAFLEESLVLRRELLDKSGIAASARFLGHLALRNGRYGKARRLHEESLAIEQELGNQLLMATDLTSLADVAEGQGDHAEAQALRRQALDLFRAVGDTTGIRRLGLALARTTGRHP